MSCEASAFSLTSALFQLFSLLLVNAVVLRFLSFIEPKKRKKKKSSNNAYKMF